MALTPPVIARIRRKIEARNAEERERLLRGAADEEGANAKKIESAQAILDEVQRENERAEQERAQQRARTLGQAAPPAVQPNVENAAGSVRADGLDFLAQAGPAGARGGQAVQQLTAQAQGAVQPTIETQQRSVIPQQVAPGVFAPVERTTTQARPNVVTAGQALQAATSLQQTQLRERNRIAIERAAQIDSIVEEQALGLGSLMSDDELNIGNPDVEGAQARIIQEFGADIGLKIISRARSKAAQETSDYRRQVRLQSLGQDPTFLQNVQALERLDPNSLEFRARAAALIDATDGRLGLDEATGQWFLREPQGEAKINAQVKNLQESLSAVDRGLQVIDELETAIREDPTIIGPLGVGRRAVQFGTQFAKEIGIGLDLLKNRFDGTEDFSEMVRQQFESDLEQDFIPREEASEIRNTFFDRNLPRIKQLENELAYLKARVRRPTRTAVVDIQAARDELGITKFLNVGGNILTGLQETRQEFTGRRSGVLEILEQAGATPIGVRQRRDVLPGETAPAPRTGPELPRWRYDLSTGELRGPGGR